MTRKKENILLAIAFVLAELGVVGASICSQGGTFGHRCGKVYPVNTNGYYKCVDRLAAGGHI